MKKKPMVCGVVGACLLSAAAVADSGTSAPPPQLVAKCQSCHGEGGNSTTASVPRLNGQKSAYIAKRLNDFFNVASEDPHATQSMWPVTSQVRSDAFASLAQYFASQPPTQNRPAGPLAESGRRIFAEGISAEDIQPCQICHGSYGQGSSTAPRLAGQHADYLQSQLERLRLLMRVSDPMFHNTKKMSDGQIRALVAFLAAD